MIIINLLLVFIISDKIYASGENSSINYFSYFGSLLFFLIIFAGVIFLALYLTKFIAKKTNSLGKGKNLKVIDFVNLSGNVKIITVKIYKKVYILSISNNYTTLIDTLDEDDIDKDFEDYLNQNLADDQNDFKKYIDSFKEKILISSTTGDIIKKVKNKASPIKI